MDVISLKEFDEQSIRRMGGKGRSLAQLINADIPVPAGFVVTTEAFEQFLDESDLRRKITLHLSAIRHDDVRTVESASEAIQTMITRAEVSPVLISAIMAEFTILGAEYVAVRSSATAEDGKDDAWAGQLDTFLNTTEPDLIHNIKKCWASLYSPRALFYQFEKGRSEASIGVAVVVQEMVQSETSGIAFSVHPITKNSNHIIIEAGYGLGEAIVSGSVTPDSYVVSKDNLAILEIGIGSQDRALSLVDGINQWHDVGDKVGQQVLNEDQIKDLSQLIITIEQLYGIPQDIEWAYANAQLYITQSRPITTLSVESEKDTTSLNKNNYLLSFWVRGVNVFVTDIHKEVYQDLEVLYVIDEGMFKQYFTKDAYRRALQRGLEFYSNASAFTKYEENLRHHCQKMKVFSEKELQTDRAVSSEILKTFFADTIVLCREYTLMNLEHTDLAFQKRRENPIIAKNLERVAVFKDEVREVMNYVLFVDGGVSDQLFTKLASQFSITKDILQQMTQAELLDLFSGAKPDIDLVSKRQEAFVERYDRDSPIEGLEAKTIIEQFQEPLPLPSEIREIRGRSASPGVVRGRVKIIPVDYGNMSRIYEEIEKMQEGDILVAETTAPELLLACKKAAAIVTDMGGLMSHAAIVARELGVPCIVGTGTATKQLADGDEIQIESWGTSMSHAALISRQLGIPCVEGTHYASKLFQDGDEVEVNASTGVVRVLKYFKQP